MTDSDPPITLLTDELRARAETGDPAAQWDLSRALMNVLMDRVDTEPMAEAEIDAALRDIMNWCKGAALQGNAEAQARLGIACATGGFAETFQLGYGYYWLYQAIKQDSWGEFLLGLVILPFIPIGVFIVNKYYPNRVAKVAYRHKWRLWPIIKQT